MVTIKNHTQDLESWMKLQKTRFSQEEMALFEKAIELAESYYNGKVFYPTDVSLMSGALTCSNIVAELNLLSDAVLACILFGVPKYTQNWRKELEPFGVKVIELIEGITRVSQIRKLSDLDLSLKEEEKAEQVEITRKMLLAMASDIRVVLIVLVARGELMLNLKSCPNEEKRQKIALETMEIFAPLANRLGLWQIKWELEDLSFKFLYPDKYKTIAKLLHETRVERLEYIEQIKDFLSNEMRDSGISNFQVSGRAKHIYSIWRKMKKKNYDFSNLYDIRAVRVLVPEVKDCFTVLGIIHTKYSPVPGEFDDYISNPKANNYQSLHTCVVGPGNKTIEIQIRTFAMHHHAEYGVAAHWRYKEGGENNPAFEEKIAWIRQILDWRDDLTDKKDLANMFKNEVFSDTIYTMTPNGRVISLPSGSTPIDFAYAVHSNVGHCCRGAKVDGQIVPLSTELKNGQRVEIITIKNGVPSINWLHEGWVKSSKAIGHIRRHIRNQNNEDFLITGKEILDRELAKVTNALRPKIEVIIHKLGYENEKSLQIALGKGDIAPIQIRNVLEKILESNKPKAEVAELTTQEYEKKISLQQEKQTIQAKSKLPIGMKGDTVLVDGVSGIMVYLAKCCKPLPGDSIVGYVTQGKGVAVHRGICPEIKRLAKDNPSKVTNVSWINDNVKNSKFNADIHIISNDRSGLLRDLTDLFASEKLSVQGLRTSCKNNKAIMTFTIQVTGSDFNFAWLISKIFNVAGVIEVERI